MPASPCTQHSKLLLLTVSSIQCDSAGTATPLPAAGPAITASWVLGSIRFAAESGQFLKQTSKERLDKDLAVVFNERPVCTNTLCIVPWSPLSNALSCAKWSPEHSSDFHSADQKEGGPLLGSITRDLRCLFSILVFSWNRSRRVLSRFPHNSRLSSLCSWIAMKNLQKGCIYFTSSSCHCDQHLGEMRIFIFVEFYFKKH